VRTKEELTLLREQAIALRREGKSRREIRQRVDVRRSSGLYRKIEGWASAAIAASGP
jgi:transposase